MTERLFGTLEFYERRLGPASQRYRWRFRYANGKKGPNGGEGFSSLHDAERSAFDFCGINDDYAHARGRIVVSHKALR